MPELLLLELLLADALADACELVVALLLDCELVPAVELAAGAAAPLLEWLLVPLPPEPPLPVPPPPPPFPPPPPISCSCRAEGLSWR